MNKSRKSKGEPLTEAVKGGPLTEAVKGRPLTAAVKGRQEKAAKKAKAPAAAAEGQAVRSEFPTIPGDAGKPAAEPQPAPQARQAGEAHKNAERKDLPDRQAGGKMSGLDAAAKVLADAGEPLNCKTVVERAVEKGLWKTGGKTPSATVYAAIIREIAKKGDAARFVKTGKGMFAFKA